MRQRILIIRLSAIGDAVLTSGLIPALRKAYPDAYLAWLAEPVSAALLQANPALDEVIVWPRPRWRQLWQERRMGTLVWEMKAFISALRRQDFTLVVDAQGLLKSGVWAWLSGAPERVGLGPREGSRIFMTRAVPRDAGEDERIGAEYRHFAAELGCDPRQFRLDLVLEENAASEARQSLRAAGVKGNYAVIAPFTTRPQKHWLETYWVNLVPRLAKITDLPVVMLGGPGDQAAAERIRRSCDEAIHDLTGATGLTASAAVVRGAALLVGVDTGLTHMGSAFRIPTVALFGSTKPYLRGDVPTTRVIYYALACSPCHYHPTCHGAYTCMRQIGVERVLAEVAAALSSRPAMPGRHEVSSR